MFEYYQALIEASVQFKVHSRILMAKHEGKEYQMIYTLDEKISHNKIDHSKEFRLLKDYAEYQWCCKQGETMAQRKNRKEE